MTELLSTNNLFIFANVFLGTMRSNYETSNSEPHPYNKRKGNSN